MWRVKSKEYKRASFFAILLFIHFLIKQSRRAHEPLYLCPTNVYGVLYCAIEIRAEKSLLIYLIVHKIENKGEGGVRTTNSIEWERPWLLNAPLDAKKITYTPFEMTFEIPLQFLLYFFLQSFHFSVLYVFYVQAFRKRANGFTATMRWRILIYKNL